MTRIPRFLFVSAWVFLLWSCEDPVQSTIPAYVNMEGFRVETDFSTEGTANHNLTTFWLEMDGENLGAFEYPASFPLIGSGKKKIKIWPGMNLNGISAYRTVYPFLKPYEQEIELVPDEEHYLNINVDSLAELTYFNYLDLVVIEDFEGAGVGLETTSRSDTSIVRVNNPPVSFTYKNEPTTSGKITLRPGALFEVQTIENFDLPKFNADVYIELNYKGDMPFDVGVFVNEPGQTTQAPVVTVYPREEWNKIYINLVTEVSAYPNADNYQIFILGKNSSSTERTFWIDNLKLIY